MKLRNLELRDAPLMLEWMHDKDMVKDLQADFRSKTVADCEAFIRASWEDTDNLNLAVTDETDTYMGTVSLKHIDRKLSSAEFAIAMRKAATGKGLACFGMSEIIRMGLEELGLCQIFWCVSGGNERAVRFYDKNGYLRVDADTLRVGDVNAMCSLPDLIYYAVNK